MVPLKALQIFLILFALIVVIEADDKEKVSDNDKKESETGQNDSKGTDSNGMKESRATETKSDENGEKNDLENGEKKQSEAKEVQTCKGGGEECVPGQCCDEHVCYPYEHGRVKKCKKETNVGYIPYGWENNKKCATEGSFCRSYDSLCCGKLKCIQTGNALGGIQYFCKKTMPKVRPRCGREGAKCNIKNDCCKNLVCESNDNYSHKHCKQPEEKSDNCIRKGLSCHLTSHKCCEGLTCTKYGRRGRRGKEECL